MTQSISRDRRDAQPTLQNNATRHKTSVRKMARAVLLGVGAIAGGSAESVRPLQAGRRLLQSDGFSPPTQTAPALPTFANPPPAVVPPVPPAAPPLPPLTDQPPVFVPSVTPAAPISPVSGAAGYTPVTAASVQSDLTATMRPRPSFSGMLSGRPIGNNNIMDAWDTALFSSFARGIETAQQYFPGFDPQVLQQLIVSEASQECTGNYSLNVGNPDPGAGDGLLQVTPQSVMKDLYAFARPIKHPDGTVMVDPQGTINLADPGQNVAIYAWYASNVVAAGESMAEKVQWGHQGDVITPVYANIMYNWFAGPHNDVVKNPGPFQDYYNRVHDYFVGAGFGTTDQFNTLMYNTSLNLSLRDVKSAG